MYRLNKFTLNHASWQQLEGTVKAVSSGLSASNRRINIGSPISGIAQRSIDNTKSLLIQYSYCEMR